jgi:hypothetical protein
MVLHIVGYQKLVMWYQLIQMYLQGVTSIYIEVLVHFLSYAL